MSLIDIEQAVRGTYSKVIQHKSTFHEEKIFEQQVGDFLMFRLSNTKGGMKVKFNIIFEIQLTVFQFFKDLRIIHF